MDLVFLISKLYLKEIYNTERRIDFMDKLTILLHNSSWKYHFLIITFLIYTFFSFSQPQTFTLYKMISIEKKVKMNGE